MTAAIHTRDTRRRAWAASLVVHAALLAGLLWLGATEPQQGVPVPVTLAPPPVPLAPARREALSWPEPRPRPRRTGPSRTLPPVPGLVPQPAPPRVPTDPRWRHLERERERAVVQWWEDRSLAAWVEDWRAGGAERDSLLDPEPLTPEEQAREAMDASFRREFFLRMDGWERERFLEAYRRNFPLMQ